MATKKSSNKVYDGKITIKVTTVNICDRLEEVKYKLDKWLETIKKPPPGFVQQLELINYNMPHLTYKLSLRPRVEDNESRTILKG